MSRGVDLEEQAQALMGPATEDEELFNADLDIGKQNYSWADKYKPRKPRFYNRVHTVSLAGPPVLLKETINNPWPQVVAAPLQINHLRNS